MDDSKIFMFPDGGTSKASSDVNSLLPLLMCNGGLNGAATQRLATSFTGGL